MQKVEEMFAVTFFNFVNSLPFVLPEEEVMTLANTSRVRHRQRMHMAAQRSKETAEQWQQFKEPGGSSLSRDSCSGRHQTGTKPEPPFRRNSRNCWQPEETVKLLAG